MLKTFCRKSTESRGFFELKLELSTVFNIFCVNNVSNFFASQNFTFPFFRLKLRIFAFLGSFMRYLLLPPFFSVIKFVSCTKLLLFPIFLGALDGVFGYF